ncbi:hypothetical protein MTR_6g033470 [Medicago truncatula]|uniref:Uncharacterized protein n=1 Tax=Medicago truncatula TaxID=3880 RepID=A0A072U7L0_MEDTR|nr:hypothetical protein MTR_6g033470 [Medicago truncatula]
MLDLSNLTFYGGENGYAEPFSAFTKLKSLIIRGCKKIGGSNLSYVKEVNIYAHIFGEASHGSIHCLQEFSGNQENVVKFDLAYYRSKDLMAPRLYEDIFEEIEQIEI